MIVGFSTSLSHILIMPRSTMKRQKKSSFLELLTIWEIFSFARIQTVLISRKMPISKKESSI